MHIAKTRYSSPLKCLLSLTFSFSKHHSSHRDYKRNKEGRSSCHILPSNDRKKEELSIVASHPRIRLLTEQWTEFFE